jgi:Putative amidoligase enzyme
MDLVITASMKEWTYGAEHELGDWDQRKGLPRGHKMDVRDVTCMNSNGIAADPKGKLWPYGGEINTPPTDTIVGQIECLDEIRALHPEAGINHRSNLHVHVRVPGLREDLAALKRVAAFNEKWLRQVLPIVEPIPKPLNAMTDEAQGEMRRWRRRKVSHHTVLVKTRTERMLAASTVEEFFRAEVPISKAGVPLWHCQPRAAVNLRQLLETDTVEFRHFPGTLNGVSLNAALHWAEYWLQLALGESEEIEVADNARKFWASAVNIPFPEYVHWKEVRYRATCHDGTNSPQTIANNIRAIQEDRFDEH